MTNNKAQEKPVQKPKGAGVLFRAIVNVCGESDVGKTTFALGNGAVPERMAFIDDDVKGQAIARDLEDAGHKFGVYHNLVSETEGMKELEFHEYCLKMIDSIEVGKYDAIVWDTFTRFERSFHPWVLAHTQDFRKYWSPNGAIKGSEIWIEAQKYESTILDRLQSKAPLVIITSHMKDENLNGIRTGKRIPDCMKPVVQKSTLRILLRHSMKAVPTGLLLKRIGKRVVTDTGIETVNVLPRKIEYRDWAKIREYWENPIGNDIPTVDQLPDDFERSMLDSSVLTEDQRLVMQLALKGVSNEDEISEGQAAMKADMEQMRAEGKSLVDIAKEYNIGVKDVAEVMK